DQTVRLWDARTGKRLHTLDHPGKVMRVAFSPDGRQLASATMRHGSKVVVKVWDTATGQAVFTSSEDPGYPFGMTVDPEWRYVVNEGPNQTVKVWDFRTKQELGVLGRHDQHIFCLTFSPDGRLLASASNDEKVKVWAWDPARLGQGHKPELTLTVSVFG